MTCLKIHPEDNVATVLQAHQCGDVVVVDGEEIVLQSSINQGHKFSLKEIKKGEYVIKYGAYIGVASQDISKGEHVHVHNIEGIRGRGDQ